MVRTETELFRESTRLILTDEGSSYFFARNQRLQRFRLLDGREEYGLQLSDYAPAVLQRLVAGGLVRKLEFPVTDVIEERHAVIDYVRVIAFGFFFRYAHAFVRSILRGSDMARAWKRANPRSDLESHDTARAIEKLLEKHREEYGRLVKTMNVRVRAAYATILRKDGQSVDTDDKVQRQQVIDTLIGLIPKEAWFLLLLRKRERDAAQFIHDLSLSLAETIKKSSVADYLALMLVELLVHMQRRRSVPQAGAIFPTLYLLTQFGQLPSAQSNVERHRLHMMVSTGNLRFEALKADLDELARERAAGSETFEQFSRSAGAGDVNLGLYYAGFFEDACRKLGIGFDSFARKSSDDGLINLVLTI